MNTTYPSKDPRAYFHPKMKSKGFVYSALGGVILICLGLIATNCGDSVNTHTDPHFTNNGHLIDTVNTVYHFESQPPSDVKFYVEVSGSMNGFFRANRATEFKTDVWQIMSDFSDQKPTVTILTNDGKQGERLNPDKFRTKMNEGEFVSSASTKVPLMLRTIIDSLDTDTSQVAVLISDMKYSPVGETAPEALMEQYETDIAEIIKNYGKAVSVVCATSNYLKKNGTTDCARSPYYYVILGRGENVANVRSRIKEALNGHFVDYFDYGYDYGYPSYSFGIPRYCVQMKGEPTFTGYNNPTKTDTCIIKLNIPIEDFHWHIADKDAISKAIRTKPKYGSLVEMGNVGISDDGKTSLVELKLCYMPTDSEVIEWTLDLPPMDRSLLDDFLVGATDENDSSKSYSVDRFLNGVQKGATSYAMKPNYILVSKNN